ncbi:helix-turn-helix transcriptional regulator [Tautonia marina]|uniref:helix-turn-helix transcriptional regulator n=1 Tax=Tautonia marina TaxID=2653855 RepID=UPI0012606B63|nr:helix-turn-helix transcriptional regulator [Tautonia marina]
MTKLTRVLFEDGATPFSPELIKLRILASSSAYGWDGLRVIHSIGGVDEPMTILSKFHQLCVPIGPQEFRVDWKTGARIKRRWHGRGVFSLFPAMEAHTFQTSGLPDVLNWNIDAAVLHRTAERELDRTLSGVALFPRLGAEDARMVDLGRRVAIALEPAVALASRLRVEELQVEATMHLLRHHSSVGIFFGPERSSVSAARLRPAAERLHDEDGTAITIEDLADLVGLSPYHFLRQFKRVVGETPHQYLIHLRIERAKGMLETGCLSIADIALQSGFSSQSHLTTFFRRQVGLTPKAYRELLLR